MERNRILRKRNLKNENIRVILNFKTSKQICISIKCLDTPAAHYKINFSRSKAGAALKVDKS